MRLAITTVVSEGICAEVRLVHLDDRATPVEYQRWRRVMVKVQVPATLEVPDVIVLTARASNAAPNSIELRAGGIYRVSNSDARTSLVLHTVHHLILRRQAAVLNDTAQELPLDFSIGGTVAWRASVAPHSYGIFGLPFGLELTFLDHAGHVISRSLYTPPERIERASLCCRRIPSTGRIYADPTPAGRQLVASRPGASSRVTFRVRANDVREGARLAVFLVPHDSGPWTLRPWQMFDLEEPQRFSFDPDARTITTVPRDGRRVAPRWLLPGQAQALVQSARGGISLVVDDDAWIDGVVARIHNHLPQPVEARLANGGHVYAAADLDAADDRGPSPALFDNGPPQLAVVVANDSLSCAGVRAADLLSSGAVTPMPAPGSEVFIIVDGTRVRIASNPSQEEE
jgi:hypothetical protein